MSKSKKTNIAKVETIRPQLPDEPIQINSTQADKVREAEKLVVEVKCKLANLTVQQLQTAQEVVQAERALVDQISELAKQFGITPDVAKEWKFDTRRMTFEKVTPRR
jgi:hypothetical protein